MRILLDTNIILDIALRREPYFENSANVFRKIDNIAVFGFVTATTITDIYYIARREKNHAAVIEFIRSLIGVVDVLGIGKEIITESLNSKITDFEDAIQSAASGLNQIDYIVTRNDRDYVKSKTGALTPEKFLSLPGKKD